MTSFADLGDVSVAVTTPCRLGESPMWHPREQVLYYCDIPGRQLNRFDPATHSVSHWNFETEVASCAPMLDGGLLLASRDGLWRFDAQAGERTLLASPPYDARYERFNDGKCDPLGGFWVGTIYEPRDQPLAGLFRFYRGSLSKCAKGITVSNGLAWSPDGRTMYWSDTKAHAIYAFDFYTSSGTLSRRRVFCQFPLKQTDQSL
ncbi:MAG: SMP-30/gluconolactonase/LRE family protein, partial [Burkholderiaceae bacterium]|nr:SMP-30/gluconolactonase/LRE family protein [Burkholderiaceae bacterium]